MKQVLGVPQQKQLGLVRKIQAVTDSALGKVLSGKTWQLSLDSLDPRESWLEQHTSLICNTHGLYVDSRSSLASLSSQTGKLEIQQERVTYKLSVQYGRRCLASTFGPPHMHTIRHRCMCTCTHTHTHREEENCGLLYILNSYSSYCLREKSSL